MPSIYIPHQATATDALLMAIRARDDMDELALQVRRSVASLDPEGHTILDLRPLSAQRAFFIEREALGVARNLAPTDATATTFFTGLVGAGSGLFNILSYTKKVHRIGA